MHDIQIDHVKYPANLKAKSDDALRFIIQNAIAGMAPHPTSPKARFHSAQIHYCVMELAARAKKAELPVR